MVYVDDREKGNALSQHPPIDLLGVKEVAKEIGVATSNLQRVGGLPEPVAWPESGRVWYGPDIRAFAKLYRKTRARGPRAVQQAC